MTIYNHKKLLHMSSAWQRGGQTGQREAGASPVCRGYGSAQAGREGTPWAQSPRGRCAGWWCRPRAVHVLHLDGDAQGLGQCGGVNVVALLARGLHLLLTELLDCPPALQEVLKNLLWHCREPEVSSRRYTTR